MIWKPIPLIRASLQSIQGNFKLARMRARIGETFATVLFVWGCPGRVRESHIPTHGQFLARTLSKRCTLGGRIKGITLCLVYGKCLFLWLHMFVAR
jgi:hypothetical protein